MLQIYAFMLCVIYIYVQKKVMSESTPSRAVLKKEYKGGVLKVQLPPVDIIQALESEVVCFF